MTRPDPEPAPDPLNPDPPVEPDELDPLRELDPLLEPVDPEPLPEPAEPKPFFELAEPEPFLELAEPKLFLAPDVADRGRTRRYWPRGSPPPPPTGLGGRTPLPSPRRIRRFHCWIRWHRRWARRGWRAAARLGRYRALSHC